MATLVINKQIQNEIDILAQSENELCGMIYGYKLEDKEEYIVSGITKPTEFDYGNPTECHRDLDSHNEQLSIIMLEDSSIRYLGEYHTHPIWFGSNPSNFDYGERRRYTRIENRKEVMFFLTMASTYPPVIFASKIKGRIFKKYIEHKCLPEQNGEVYKYDEEINC